MKVALTGMIGAGKSTALAAFERRGWSVLKTDEVAREVALSPEGLAMAAELMGKPADPYSEAFKGRFVRDKDFKEAWEAFVHPKVRLRWEEFAKAHDRVVVELPLLYENELESRFDKVVVLTTSDERAQQRWKANGRSLELYRALSKQQLPIDFKTARADFVISNNSTKEDLDCQIEALQHKLTHV